jgi:hypothetical protein
MNEITKTGQFKLFVNRHNRFFTFAGAVIVFFTFVIKDGLHERWKSQAGSLDMAQYFYAVRHDTTSANADLGYLRGELAKLKQIVVQGGSLPLANGDDLMLQNIGRLSGLADDVDASLSNLDILMGKLANQQNNEAELKGLDTRLGKLRNDLSQLVYQVTKGAGSDRSDIAVQKEGAVVGFAVDLQRDSEAFVTKVLKQAEETRKRNERKTEYSWWISAVLYGIGWGLGLVARLFHIPVAGEEL